MKDVPIHQVGERERLAPRREPYWGRRLALNRTLGYRKINAKSGSWIARLQKPGGKREFKALGIDSESFGYEEAHLAAAEWFALKDGGVADSGLTVKAACAKYVSTLRDQKKLEGTAHDAEMRFERLVNNDVLARVRLVDLKKHHMQTWVSGLKGSASSVHRNFTSLRAALNLAVRQEQVGVQVQQAWIGLEFPDPPKNRRMLFLDLKQRRRLLKATTGALRDLIEGAMVTGARPGELVNAVCSQFDARTGNMTFIGKTRRKVVPRTVTLAEPALGLFKKLTKDKPATAFIFTRDDGLRWNHSDWDEAVKAAAKTAKLPDETILYTCRHSFISQAINDGMTTVEISKFTGTSLQMIELHYGKVLTDDSLKRMAKIKFV